MDTIAPIQLTLGLTLRDDATFLNFYAGNNQALLTHLQAFVTDDGEPFIYLWGPSGAGRTHLLQACCHAVAQGIYLDLAEPALQPGILVDMEYFPLVCLDNIEAVIGRLDWELALFHFYNRSREQGARLLTASLMAPAQLSCQLADLSSRLAWGLVLALAPLSDEEKLSALQMRAKRRGLALSAKAGNFLLHHYPRRMRDLFLALDILDKESMVARRRLTIPFIKRVLEARGSLLSLSTEIG